MLRRTFLAACIFVIAGLTIAGPPAYYPPALGDFDGANDYLSRTGDLTGNADGKTGIFSTWFRLDGGSGLRFFFHTINSAVYAHVVASGEVRLAAKDYGFNTDLYLLTTTKFTDTNWHHVLFSWDVANSEAHVYVDGAEDQFISQTILNDDTLDYTGVTWGLLSRDNGTDNFPGAVAELYFAPNQYLDLSIESNRRKFITAEGYPVDLGASGYKPTGTAPLVYMRTQFNNCGLNSGTGGDFVINGSPDYTVGPVPFFKNPTAHGGRLPR